MDKAAPVVDKYPCQPGLSTGSMRRCCGSHRDDSDFAGTGRIPKKERGGPAVVPDSRAHFIAFIPPVSYSRATPLSRAAWATALATASLTRGSKGAGMMYSGFSSFSAIRPAKARAAAIFI